MKGHGLSVTATVVAILVTGFFVVHAQPGQDADEAEDRVRTFFERHDANHDGRLSREEFPGTDAAFARIDMDGDGFITLDELRAARAPAREARREVPADRATRWRQMLQRFDADGDGRISREEWQGRDEVFERLDANNDGFLTEDEVVRPLALEAERRPQRVDPAQMLIRLMDTSGDGRISSEEWAAFFELADENGDGYLTHGELFKQYQEMLRPRAEPADAQ